MATRLDMIEEHISQIESTQRRDMDFRAKSQGDSCRRMLWLKDVKGIVSNNSKVCSIYIYIYIKMTYRIHGQLELPLNFSLWHAYFCPFLGEVLSKSLGTVEYQLSEMSKDVGRKFTHLKQLDTRLGSCEHLITEVPTLRYTIAEEVRSAQIREAALSERLEYIEKLATSLSDRLCRSDESGTEMDQRKFFNDVEDLRRLTVQQAAQLEALRKELSLEKAHSREGVADLQHRITECNNQLVSFQRFMDTCDSLNLKSSSYSSGTSKRLAGIDLQLSENREQLLLSEAQFSRGHHAVHGALQKHSDRVDGLEERLVRCEHLFKGPGVS